VFYAHHGSLCLYDAGILGAVGGPAGRIRGGNSLSCRATLCPVGRHLVGLVWIRHRNVICSHPADRTSIYVANHKSYLDAAISLKPSTAAGTSPGRVEMTVPSDSFTSAAITTTVDHGSRTTGARSDAGTEIGPAAGHLDSRVSRKGAFNTTSEP